MSVAVLFVGAIGVASEISLAQPIAMLGWPGLLVVNAVCARLMIFAQTPGNFRPMFLAGLVVDVFFYALFFFLVVKARRIIASKNGG